MPTNIEIARQYLRAIEDDTANPSREGEPPSLRFFAPDVEQVEYPNRFVPNGATRGLRELREAVERGRGS